MAPLPPPSLWQRWTERPLTPREIALLTRQLATLLQAGVPMLQAFELLGRGQHKPAWQRLLAQLRSALENGNPLSSALAQHPHNFSPLYRHLVAAGESAGILDDLLLRLAQQLEKAETIKARLRAALLYPGLVVLVSAGVVAVVLLKVIPAFEQVFSTLNSELPGPTRWVLTASHGLAEHGLSGLLLSALLGLVLTHAWRHRPSLRHALERNALRLPVLGELLQKACMARWSRTLSAMLAAGVPMLEALASVGQACGNSVYERATESLRHAIHNGQSLSLSLAQQAHFPALLVQMSAVGEESGALEGLLGKCADFYEEEVDRLVSALSSLLEPLIMVVLGLIIGAIVIAMYLPIFQLGQLF